MLEMQQQRVCLVVCSDALDRVRGYRVTETEHVTFIAAFPSIQCIRFLGDGGARIVLDIPQSDEGAVESLRQWRDRLLMITVVPMQKGALETGDCDREHHAPMRREAKRRVVQGDASL